MANFTEHYEAPKKKKNWIRGAAAGIGFGDETANFMGDAATAGLNTVTGGRAKSIFGLNSSGDNPLTDKWGAYGAGWYGGLNPFGMSQDMQDNRFAQETNQYSRPIKGMIMSLAGAQAGGAAGGNMMGQMPQMQQSVDTQLPNMMMNDSANSNDNYFAYGGKLKYAMGGEISPNPLSEFSGATHENGGIDLGVAEVEGGETKFNAEDYVFSDRLKTSEGKTFAQKSKQIKNKYKDREDPQTEQALNEELERLAMEQDVKKEEQMMRDLQKLLEKHPELAEAMMQPPQPQQPAPQEMMPPQGMEQGMPMGDPSMGGAPMGGGMPMGQPPVDPMMEQAMGQGQAVAPIEQPMMAYGGRMKPKLAYGTWRPPYADSEEKPFMLSGYGGGEPFIRDENMPMTWTGYTPEAHNFSGRRQQTQPLTMQPRGVQPTTTLPQTLAPIKTGEMYPMVYEKQMQKAATENTKRQKQDENTAGGDEGYYTYGKDMWKGQLAAQIPNAIQMGMALRAMKKNEQTKYPRVSIPVDNVDLTQQRADLTRRQSVARGTQDRNIRNMATSGGQALSNMMVGDAALQGSYGSAIDRSFETEENANTQARNAAMMQQQMYNAQIGAREVDANAQNQAQRLNMLNQAIANSGTQLSQYFANKDKAGQMTAYDKHIWRGLQTGEYIYTKDGVQFNPNYKKD